MPAAYITETCQKPYRNRTILIENITPANRTWEEREKAKKAIEDRLYYVFRGYEPVKS